MSSLVVDTKTLALQALGDLTSADEIAPALERLREPSGPTAPGRRDDARSLATRMVTG